VAECAVCGRPVTGKNKTGVCTRSPDCKREYFSRRHAANAEAIREQRALYRTANAEAIREYRVTNAEAISEYRALYIATNAEAIREYRVSYRAANAKAIRERNRERMQRPDRPCRYAKTGCTEYAKVGQKACPEHYCADQRRRHARKRDKVKQKLAVGQGGNCTWCELPLPEDLDGTHTDHIIPVARGGPDVEWNWQLLHAFCNQSKQDKIIPIALELAAEHGISLAAAA